MLNFFIADLPRFEIGLKSQYGARFCYQSLAIDELKQREIFKKAQGTLAPARASVGVLELDHLP